MDTYAAGAVLITASALASISGLMVLRRFGYFRNLIVSHEASGQYLSVVGTLYAVLLGLIVIDAMDRFEHAVDLVGTECNALGEVIYLSGRMPGPLKEQVHRRTGEYARLVLEQEWPRMSHGEHLPEARRACLELMRALRDWEPSTESEKTIYAAALSAGSEFWDARRSRIMACQQNVPFLEWCAVLLGAFVTVGLTYFLVLDDVRIQVALTAMVAVLIGLNIFLILMFAYPFSGDVRVSPEGYNVILNLLKIEAGPGTS